MKAATTMTAGMLIVSAVWAPPAAAGQGPPPLCFGEEPTIVGTEENETVRGTPRRDVIDGRDGNDTVIGRGGDDLVCDSGGAWNTLIGGRGRDRMVGNTYSIDTLRGGRGNDVLISNGNGDELASEVMFGGPGDDDIRGWAGHDDAFGGPGDDLIRGSVEDGDYDNSFDLLAGGSGSDRIEASPSRHTRVEEGAGDDHIIASSDTTVDYRRATGPVTIDLTAGTARGAGRDRFENVTAAIGGPFGDTLVGSESSNGLSGGDGDDVLEGLGGDDFIGGWDGADQIDGGDGDDFVFPGKGRDRIHGGDGKDMLDYNDVMTGISADLATGRASAEGVDILDSIESVDGPSGYRSKLIGDEGANELLGGWRGDDIRGRGGNDRLEGFGSDDRLVGGAGDDFLDGDGATGQPPPDDDFLDGGDGTDTCINGERLERCEA